MKIEIISFTDRGQRLAELLAGKLEGTSARCGDGVTLREWAEEAFACADALIYVGAAGICVRSIAPHIRSKTTDPAVVVVDETGKYAIPILSGHLGGANDLARKVAAITGGEAVITTATDRNNVFSVDAWARIQGCAVENPGKIKDVSMKLLDGRDIVMESDYPIEGAVPEHVILRYLNGDEVQACTPSENGECADREIGSFALMNQPPDVVLTIRRRYKENGYETNSCTHKGDGYETNSCTHKEGTHEIPLRIIPRIVCAGVGCRKGIPAQNVENAIRAAFEQAGMSELALCGIFSIDIKKEEDGLREFCRRRKVPFVTFSAEQLAAVPGDFTSSAFVREVAGVDNVCERSAVLGTAADSSGRLSTETTGQPRTDSVKQSAKTSEQTDAGAAPYSSLILRKYVCEGVTVALAVREFRPDFQWMEG